MGGEDSPMETIHRRRILRLFPSKRELRFAPVELAGDHVADQDGEPTLADSLSVITTLRVLEPGRAECCFE